VAKRIVYTLSGGAAFGYAHVGVLKFFEEQGIRPSAVVGTSMGAVVGALYAYGYNASQIEDIASQVRSRELVRLFFPSFPRGGIIDTNGIRDFFHSLVGDVHIEELPIPYRSVAVDVMSGEEIVFDQGPLLDAVMPSMSIPGIFKPYRLYGRYLIDGGLLNNLPWDIGNELARVNILVNVVPKREEHEQRRKLSSELGAELHGQDARQELPDRMQSGDFRRGIQQLIRRIRARDEFSLQELAESLIRRNNHDEGPGIADVVTNVLAILNDRIQIPTGGLFRKIIYLEPRLAGYYPGDFHRAPDIIEEGYQTAVRSARSLRKLS
jgi:NTE family protein